MTPTDAGLDECVDVAVEHGLGLGGFVAGAQILDHLVWVQHVGTHLITPAGLDVAGEFLLLLGFLFVTQHQQSGLQHGHGGGAVLNLRTLVLHGHDDAGRNVGDAHRGIRGVHALAARGLPKADVNVLSIDKFPRMVDYVVPTGVRIGDADRVRLGAHLSEGTTVMHAGFVNFNAGTLGVSMVEGRVSQGVVVGNGSDIGGGASIMGTLSGGGKLKNSIGEHSLLGANAGIGISLGDNCVVEAGLYVTAGTKVTIYDKAKVAAGEPLETVKGADLSGKDNILFIRNSVSGRIEARYRKTGIELNETLHNN